MKNDTLTLKFSNVDNRRKQKAYWIFWARNQDCLGKDILEWWSRNEMSESQEMRSHDQFIHAEIYYEKLNIISWPAEDRLW